MLLEQYGLTQLVNDPTTIHRFTDDLFITNIPDKVNKLVIRGYDYDSDHFTIEAFLNWTKNKLLSPKWRVYDISKANFVDLKNHFTQLNHTYLDDTDIPPHG